MLYDRLLFYKDQLARGCSREVAVDIWKFASSTASTLGENATSTDTAIGTEPKADSQQPRMRTGQDQQKIYLLACDVEEHAFEIAWMP
ncbi:MAG: hypothetical protein AAGC55_29705 [Myxococcota bacterium]